MMKAISDSNLSKRNYTEEMKQDQKSILCSDDNASIKKQSVEKIDESIKRQLDKGIMFFLKYYPVRIKNVREQQKADRQTVWNFKDGKEFEQVARMTAGYMSVRFGKRTNEIVFSCVPASSADKNELRYKNFSEKVCELTGAINGYNHVKVSGKRDSIHKRYVRDNVNNVQTIDFDEHFFKGKRIVIFDDVITRGVSYGNYANRLEQFGADVLGGIFLAKTAYKV